MEARPDFHSPAIEHLGKPVGSRGVMDDGSF